MKGILEEDNFVKEKFCSLLYSIAICEWDRNWKDMISNLIEYGSKSYDIAEIITIFFKQLAEGIKEFTNELPQHKRKSLNELLFQSKEIIQFLFSV